MRLRRRVFMTPDMLRVKWECALSLLSLDSLTGVRYLPFHLVRLEGFDRQVTSG
jgi:hypothetical protein